MKSLFTALFVATIPFSAPAGDAVFTLASPTFKEGGSIPAKCAMKGVNGGQNISPSLSWRNPPPGTKSFAVTCIDIHPIAHKWVHWMLVGIPSNIVSLQEGASGTAMPKGSWELLNSFDSKGWGGPMPPQGSGLHKYVFTIYAMSVEIPGQELSGSPLTEAGFLNLWKDRTIGSASITGTFER